MPCTASASGSAMPSLSFSPRASSMSRFPEHAEEPNRLLPKRAPSSSAQSTSRTVTGGLPSYCAWMRRRISTPASTFRQPSSQPPFGTESMWPPMSSAFSDSPRQRGPQIARRIRVRLHRQLRQFRLQPLARLRPGRREGDALRAVFVAGECAEFLQFGHRSFWFKQIQSHSSFECH